MATTHYPAIVERAGDMFAVFFPDLPGLTSAGDTVTEALLNAEEAIVGHLAVSVQYGDEITDPSDIGDIPVDPDVDEVARALVQAGLPGKPKRINITMDEGLVTAIDRVTNNRSGFLAQAARDKLAAA